MAYNNLVFEVEGGIATITINRPDALNALNNETLHELDDAILKADSDTSVGAVLLTGSGDKSFVAGADIKELAQQGTLEGKEFSLFGQAVFQGIADMRKPVIAAINGFALGGGCELAMACHLRYAHTTARFGQPEVNLGIIPGYGGTQRLTRLVGYGNALELLLTGNMVNAERAYQIGLVNDVIDVWKKDEKDEFLLDKKGRKLMDREAFLAEVKKRIGTILSKAPLAVRYTLEAAKRGMDASLADGQKIEADLFGLTCSTDDFKEGTAAFIEKREANYKGQ